jgi:hypothetical protein
VPRVRVRAERGWAVKQGVVWLRARACTLEAAPGVRLHGFEEPYPPMLVAFGVSCPVSGAFAQTDGG